MISYSTQLPNWLTIRAYPAAVVWWGGGDKYLGKWRPGQSENVSNIESVYGRHLKVAAIDGTPAHTYLPSALPLPFSPFPCWLPFPYLAARSSTRSWTMKCQARTKGIRSLVRSLWLPLILFSPSRFPFCFRSLAKLTCEREWRQRRHERNKYATIC